MKKYYIKTFGCVMNQADSEKINMILIQSGFIKVNNWDEADLIIFNTCSVRQKWEDRVFWLINDFIKNKTPPPRTSGTPLENGRNKFKKWYYKIFITPYTAIIDLSKGEEDILKDMKPKGRYNIKLAWKKWVEVKEVEKNNKNIKQFYNLMKQTTWRNWFAWNKLDYYIKFLEQIENSKLLLAYFEDKVIAGWIFIFDKEVSIYYYWASTSDVKYRNLMAPFLLQWEAIKIAKKSWSKIYDFLWVANPWNKKSSLSWVTDFKMKLTKEKINVSESFIYVNKKIFYTVIKLLRKIKWL